MRVQLAKERQHRETVQPWLEARVPGMPNAEPGGASLMVFLLIGLVGLAWVVAAFASARGADAFHLVSSITGPVLSTLAAGFAYWAARIAVRAGHSAAEAPLEAGVSIKPATLISDVTVTSADAYLQKNLEAEAAVLMRALEVFGDRERATQWMRENNPALKNEPPIRVVPTEGGRQEVMNILGRIQHGVIS